MCMYYICVYVYTRVCVCVPVGMYSVCVHTCVCVFMCMHVHVFVNHYLVTNFLWEDFLLTDRCGVTIATMMKGFVGQQNTLTGASTYLH